MQLMINHETRYSYESPVSFGLMQLRKTPKSTHGQHVQNWQTTVSGGKKELQFEDFHRNVVELISIDAGTTELVIRSQGSVAMRETHGVVGLHQGPAPLWLFQRATPLTRAGTGCRGLIRQVSDGADLDRLHGLSAVIGDAVAYQAGQSETGWSAEDAIEHGRGVCQDHAHIFVACAREMGFPARYVSGYLMMDDRVSQDATHAWAEAHVEGLGWVGFDVSNGISPDMRYVRVATGLDYTQAAPVSGTRRGGDGETLSVSVQVAQQ